ncbi:MAG: bifunctional (p)ppGpp synthetase/guanosine-3',5'-bis(diphosphate) 3'-pyrophosphohydrolase [Bernardetiaceae bacterium]|nr:bifunctional (p)ppGpp synthetase/guanosine-3',5'-bis(diphosphate) 3'-pyrophosphohydrolase [Bernardetiaceae bacterium]
MASSLKTNEKIKEGYTKDHVLNAEAEKKEILKRYRALLRLARPYLKPGDAKNIKKAFNIAHDAHKDVRRKSGEPYIYHPLEVARIVVEEMGLGTTSIICALLHDVVEDTEVELKDLEEVFGDNVAKIIDGLTKVPNNFETNKSQQAETFRKVLLTISEDIRVVLIKIADRLHNMRTLESMPKEKKLKIKAETQYIYAPLAHRLGLYNIRSEFEDLSLKYSNIEAYNKIIAHLKNTKAARTRFINEFKKPIVEELDKLGYNYTIKSRLKSVASIWNKMQKQSVSFDEVYDLFAIRIIIDIPEREEKASCWRVYSIVTDFYQPNTKRLRDWISIPKANGYESLHTTVMSRKGQWVEVQIRSKRMDEIAEKGYAAHWKYKGSKDDKSERGIEQWINKVRETIENNELSALEFMDDFRSNFFKDEVYIFTPQGDVKVMPAGHTVLDFAFEIHSEIGEHCMGGKVNHKLVPLTYALQNGDQVEILTSSKPKVNEGWLKIVKSSRARTKIKQLLKKDQKEIMEQGKEIIQRKLRQLSMPYDDEVLNQLVDYFATKNVPQLYLLVGKGAIEHTEIKRFRESINKNKLKEKELQTSKEEATPLDKPKPKRKDAELVIGGSDADMEYSLSSCCRPIPGDDIFGIVTVSRGIRVHRTDCPNAVEMMASFGDRIISVRWAKDKDKRFEIGLHIIGTDRMGIVNDITRVISNQHKVNILSISIKARKNVFEGRISLSVVNKNQVETLIQEITRVEGVVNIQRYDE